MRPIILRAVLGVVALLLLVTPLLVRTAIWHLNARPYSAQVISPNLAATPVPTVTPAPLAPQEVKVRQEMRAGPVIVDLAHGNRLNRNQFEPLAAALARRGVGLRFWLGNVDVLSVTNYLDYPDQSEELEGLLEDASALIVASPFFLWSPAEIGLVERFVADGGHLLLISDPDVLGDLAQDINNLAEPFGIVFNDDYLYDTTRNDGNHTYIFQQTFLDQAAHLADRTIVFYGARSISGEIAPQVRTTHTTLSSLRSGITDFVTVALGGLTSSRTAWRVLAMTDFDVLTAPFVERHDNQHLVEFVADFLAAAQRSDTVTDFPAYLGKEVALVFGNAEAVDAEILLEGARLQRSLELSGRNLELAGSTLLTATLMEGAAIPEVDLIALADFTLIAQQTNLLGNLGFRLLEVTATPTPGAEPDRGPSAEPPVTPQPPAATAALTTDVEITGVGNLTATGALTGEETITGETTPSLEATPSPEATPETTPTPQPVLYLEKADGLRLLARETVLIAQLQLDQGHRLVAVIGHNNAGIRAGVDRLLSRDYSGCVTGPDLAVCSFEPGETMPVEPPATQTPAPTPTGAGTPSSVPAPATPEGGEAPTASILLVDDNDLMGPTDTVEADIYLQVLTQLGYQPVLWTTSGQGIPTAAELGAYRWVIWSSGGYENGGPGLNALDAMLGYINTGGNLTISSRRPFFGMGADDPSVIADVQIDDDLPALVEGLPSETIELPSGLPPVTPLETGSDEEGPRVALRRGPDSGNAGAPLLFLATDEGEAESTGARLMVLGMSLTWLPNDYDKQLVRNMAEVMLAGN
ncbi:MAG TPA: hypothetical protein VNK95_17345 [Caldilineaceae bacterium]|nr:hypothetical protein [Caldilineaceae bacterium]